MSLHNWLDCYDPPSRTANRRLRKWLAIICISILAAYIVLRFAPIHFGIMPAN